MPAETSAIVRAAEWLEALVTGTLATSVAVIAIALVGFAMLSGRLEARRGASVVVGCFIIFGAPAIAQALMGLSKAEADITAQPDTAAAQAPPAAPNAPPAHDPYSGASIIR